MYYYSGFSEIMFSVPKADNNKSVLEQYRETVADFFKPTSAPNFVNKTRSNNKSKPMYYYSGFPQSMTSVPKLPKKGINKKIILLGGLLGLFYFLTKKN